MVKGEQRTLVPSSSPTNEKEPDKLDCDLAEFETDVIGEQLENKNGYPNKNGPIGEDEEEDGLLCNENESNKIEAPKEGIAAQVRLVESKFMSKTR